MSWFRSMSHGRERARVRDMLLTEQWEIGVNPAFGNEWDSPRDGKFDIRDYKWGVHKDCNVRYAFCDRCSYDQGMRK